MLGGGHLRMHAGARAEPVLCVWGITTQGSPVLVGLASGSDDGHDPWAGFIGELVDRGLRPPLPVITDGIAGLVGGVEVCLPPACGSAACSIPYQGRWHILAECRGLGPTTPFVSAKTRRWQRPCWRSAASCEVQQPD